MWTGKQYAKAVTAERDSAGPYGRFAPGLPATSDGQMLFLLHLAHKMRAPEDGGGRVGIVMNGSPLFNGAAESGPSNIRSWLLENDLVEAIVALHQIFARLGTRPALIPHVGAAFAARQ